jgi:hypothetical protein
LNPWQRTLRAVIYRARVRHETRTNSQLALFGPADDHYAYSAVVTNKALGPVASVPAAARMQEEPARCAPCGGAVTDGRRAA